MPVRPALSLAGAALVVLAGAALPTRGRMPVPTPEGLVGTWQVSRTCLTGCSQSSVVTEVIRPRGVNVYAATGGAALVLYRMGSQVLVHTATTSSLLTIRVPGQVMSGSGVSAAGTTFKTTWRCLTSAVGPAAVTVGAAGMPARPPASTSDARGVC